MLNVAILGASGAVGQELLSILEQRQFPLSSLKLLASPRSAGRKVPFRGRLIEVEAVTADSFKGVHIGLFSAGGSVSAEWAPIAAAAGASASFVGQIAIVFPITCITGPSGRVPSTVLPSARSMRKAAHSIPRSSIQGAHACSSAIAAAICSFSVLSTPVSEMSPPMYQIRSSPSRAVVIVNRGLSESVRRQCANKSNGA